MALTGREKATIFLSILGAETSSRILRYLPDELADLIAAGINHLPTPSPEALSEVLEDYQSYLALPQAAYEAPLPPPSTPRRSYAFLMYERPQTAAFLISLFPEEERGEVLHALPRDRAVIEELLTNLKSNFLHDKIAEKLKEKFSGKLF